MRAVGRRGCGAIALASALFAASGCVPGEKTTPLGYVIAPSSPPGAPLSADGGGLDLDARSGGYSSAASESDARR